MADLCLTNAMDSSETLLQSIWIPWQIVVDREVRAALEVDTLACRVVRNQHAHLWVIIECRNSSAALLTRNATMNDFHGVRIAKARRDLFMQVVERVPWLGEDQDFLLSTDFGFIDRRLV